MTYAVRQVVDHQWEVVAWLWQDFRTTSRRSSTGSRTPTGATGRAFALDVIARHPGAWAVPFQHANTAAGAFWRSLAAEAWGPAWTETTEPVPGKPDVPPDRWIRTC